MEKTPLDQQIKKDSIISTGSQKLGPSFCTTTHISPGNNSGAKTLIEYDIDEYLDIKEEIVQDEEVHQWGEHNLLSGKNELDKKCIATEISSDNNSVAKTLIEYDIDESLDIKEEIIQDQQTKNGSNESTETHDGGSYSCTATQISSVNDSGGKTLIEYDIDKSLDIKEEIFQEERKQHGKHNFLSGKDQLDEKCITTEISSKKKTGPKTLIENEYEKTLKMKEQIVQDQERPQRGKHNRFLKRNQLHGKYIATEMSSDNTSGSKTLIEYDIGETLKIKEEIIQDQENIDTREADIMTVRKPRTSKKKNLQVSKSVPKNMYSCDKCARSYAKSQSFYKHQKYDCGVMPQFSCEFCGKRFKRKSNMKQHIELVHQKTNSKTSRKRHHCDKCSRSYIWLRDLFRHKRAEHAVIKPQFTCDFCGFKTKRKYYLANHITSRHFQRIQVSAQEKKKKYKCSKCARSYSRSQSLYEHKKFDCGVIPQFSCEFCGKRFKRKTQMNRHTSMLHVHQKTYSRTSQARHNCDKCSRSYICLGDLNTHKRIEHAVINRQFICNFCGYKTKRKPHLSRHITSQHLRL